MNKNPKKILNSYKWLYFCRKSTLNSHLKAFSLLEVAISLVVMGLIISAAVPTYNRFVNAKKYQQSKKLMDSTMYALALYVKDHNKLPCPASNTSGFAMQSCLGFSKGYVPYNTLGLDPKYAKNGFGRWLTYVMDGFYSQQTFQGLAMDETNKGLSHPSAYLCNAKGNFSIQIYHRDTQTYNNHADYSVALALISHGKNGGNYDNNGYTQAITSNSAEKHTNADNSSTIHIAPFDPKNFDDYVIYFTMPQFLYEYLEVRCG